MSEVIVIGGGIAGICAALELLEANRRILMLDRDKAENFGGLAKESFGGIFLVNTPEQRRAGIRDTMGIDQDPDVTFVKRWDKGIPSYAPGHVARVDAIFARLERTPGLYLNCNAYRGIAMNDCARNGRELAQRIAAS